MTPSERIISVITERDIKFVDYRFTDTLGREHHLTVPAHAVDEDQLESGLAFDGSSLPGWAGIEASDMVLLPDATTVRSDPFREDATLIITCDVAEPADLKGYARDPRSLAK